ncbi:ABC transporter substrate-binding protein [Paracoccus laeviglucosivorans]|uniref:Carbohydrate ABC transporter substrate-binding protein, CUT1 family n=1 Tax=Paracoccus laeviglucosivorans TaxID=1197861 RepID=A0A521DJI3_9RHOB|nr:ABC transporter substrate-binding protein [Paracoccus laeviglucosivorans]SMO71768.1 carbohydrate ABC transporter substrate-binding protein, CUT1 family [Paracoccus laeviglucosivorans]
MSIDRRKLLKTGAAIAAVSVLPTPFVRRASAQAAGMTFTPEEGASLRLLRWVPFVAGEEAAWNANTQAFTEATGVQVRIDQESWEDVRPKAAVAANVGSGPDMVMSWFDDPFQYPDKLVDVTDLCTMLGEKNGGWYDGLRGYGEQDGKFISTPLCAIGNAICYRDSHVKAAGFDTFPTTTDEFLKLCQALKEKGTPAGFPFGKAVGDGNNFAHWLLWSHGGQTVNEAGEVAINTPETAAAIEYAKQLYASFIPGTESWLDINNNRAFLAGDVSLTANGVSLYYSAMKDDATKELAADIRTAILPIGPIGQSVELHQASTISIFQHCKFPNAAKAYLEWMYQADHMNAWIEGASAYCCPALKDFSKNPVWTSNPIHEPYSKASGSLRPNGYAGPLGPASAGTMADYVLVDMFAEAVTGQRSTEDAIRNAERRIGRYYR